jgi:chromosome segregation ATPase
MSQLFKSGKGFLAEFFAKSGDPISEKLTSEEYETFKAELEEANTRIATQLEGNTKLKADYDAAVVRADAAELKFKEIEPKLTEATAKVSTLTAENERLDKWFKEHKGAVNGTSPGGDANNGGAEDPTNKFKAGSVMHAALGLVSK